MAHLSIIFDLDGTLLDTLAGLARCGNQALVHCKMPAHPIDAYRRFVGDGMEKLVERMAPAGADSSALAAVLADFRRRYTETWREDCFPYPGILEMLNGLQEQGCRMAVLSNKPHPYTVEFVANCFSPNLFQVVYGDRPAHLRKPDPTVALDILRQLDSTPFEAIFVGDSAVDIHTGKAAGMAAFGVKWGFRGEEELRANGADLILQTPRELVDHVATRR